MSSTALRPRSASKVLESLYLSISQWGLTILSHNNP